MLTLFDIVLLFQVALSGGVTVSGGVDFAPTTDIAATPCSTTADTAWTDHSIPTGFYTPFDVAASATQSGDGCAQSSKLQPSVSLP